MDEITRRALLAGGAAVTITAAAGAVGSAPAHADVAPPGSVSYPVADITPPDQKMNWTPDADRAALLVHDMQHYFVKVFAGNKEPYLQLIGNIRRLLDAAHAAKIPVLYSGQPGGMTRAQRGLGYDINGPGMPDDDKERAVVAPIKPSDSDTFVTKWRDNAFHSTNLEQLVRWHRRDQLIVCGIYAFTGVTVTSAHAYWNDIQPFIISDAVADLTAQRHKDALAWGAARTSRILTTDAALEAITA
nr:isochorismatase family protein [Kibdelosporangium sp. MJ126-NF4]CEL16477.1 Isochorismatase of siderophore biosynthesis [Kibdelosporangium sp. MJ126-NF4]CTQ90429.1 Isochorismatase (EC 3.3.2.1) of siderophore biosynthesis [Kibdelosporangium sp. MJ126-NF4]